MKRGIFYMLTVFLVLWLQMAVNYFAGYSGLSVDAVLVVVLFFGLSQGPLSGVMMGFLWGLLMDASSLGLLGLHALLFATAGYFAGMLRRQLDERKVWTQTIFSLGVSFVYGILFFILDRLFSLGPHPFSWSMLAQPFLNAALAPVLFWMMLHWGQLWDMSVQQE